MKPSKLIQEITRRKNRLEQGKAVPGRVSEILPGGVRRELNPEAFRQRQAAAYAASITGVRDKLGLSQQQFADMLGISRRTLENWEQGHREPTGAAKVLIKIAAKHPKAVLEAVA